MARIWWTALRTGRWLKGGGRSHYFPSIYYTFSVYDRRTNPVMYRLGVIVIPALFFSFLLISVALTVGFFGR
jgi:hypothetical protein